MNLGSTTGAAFSAASDSAAARSSIAAWRLASTGWISTLALASRFAVLGRPGSARRSEPVCGAVLLCGDQVVREQDAGSEPLQTASLWR